MSSTPHLQPYCACSRRGFSHGHRNGSAARAANARFVAFRLGRALPTGVIAGLVFCPWIELVKYRAYLPHGVDAALHAAFSALIRVAEHAGSSGFALVMPFALAATVAAMIAASRPGAFNTLYGCARGRLRAP
ncbi:valine--tRNA ligase [Caballeronia novacaledonica]|uniref:Uncharacterized protein n=1 Tax=Caballeronia novacaledonica TaxID=1544861 RepID=A0AA37IIZ9_9BURK|nr:valine--tRNA ligase [Caballeronia novacaledonica]GJH30142.1 hypothetical protein CBA19CS42_36520 [Caballeronia novacaledonica]